MFSALINALDYIGYQRAIFLGLKGCRISKQVGIGHVTALPCWYLLYGTTAGNVLRDLLLDLVAYFCLGFYGLHVTVRLCFGALSWRIRLT